MQSWHQHCEKCVCLQGDYVEKWLHFQLPRMSDFFNKLGDLRTWMHHVYIYTGLFISPSGISELDCATTKTETAERSISTDRESIQVFFFFLFFLEAFVYLQVPPLGGSHDEKWRSQWIRKRSVSWNLPKLSQLWRCNGGFGSCTTQNHLQTKQFVNGTWNSSRVAAGRLGPSAETVERVREAFVRSPQKSTTRGSEQLSGWTKTWRDSLSIDMLLSAVSVLVVAQSIFEILEGFMNNPVYIYIYIYIF